MIDRAIERMPTGVPGLDTVLHGGVFRGGIYIVQGTPGAGKTILANQLCFNHVAAGGRALYVTLLTESHTRLLSHLAALSFFDEAALPDRVAYLSAFRLLEEDGLKGLVDTLRREIRARKVTLLILDGLVSAEETAGTPREFKKFIHELQTQAGLTDCTMVLLTSALVEQRFVAAEHTMVDGLFEVQTRMHGRRSERAIQVHKMRGSAFHHGLHSMRITDDGVRVFPRTEALLAQPTVPDGRDGPLVSTGVAGLDAMLGGGLPRHSVTLVMGPPGSGKTTTGLHFLGASDEPGLLVGFHETPAAFAYKAESLGLPVARMLADGRVATLWQPPTEGLVDEVAQTLLDTVRARGVRRVFIDGIEGFDRLTDEKDRVAPFLSALTNELRCLGVTTMATGEMDLGGIVPGQPLAGLSIGALSPFGDAIVALRYAAAHATVRRFASVLKSRDTAIDLRLRGFTIGRGGLAIDPDAEAAEAFLRDIGRFTGLGDLPTSSLPAPAAPGA